VTDRPAIEIDIKVVSNMIKNKEHNQMEYKHPYIYPLRKTKHLLSGDSKVYFITDRKYVKIGKAINIVARLSQLQTGHPEQLHLLGYVDGDVSVEKELQKEFSKYHYRGEWFKLTEEFANKIKEIHSQESRNRISYSMKGNTNGKGHNQYDK